jgi:hypothetical protein
MTSEAAAREKAGKSGQIFIEPEQPTTEPSEEKPEKRSRYAIPKRKIVISDENAHELVMKLLIRNNIDLDLLEDDDDLKSMENHIDIIKRAVMFGDLDIYEEDDELMIKQNFQFRSKKNTWDHIIFGEVRGRAHKKAQAGGSVTSRSLSIMAHMAKCQNDTAEKIIDNLRSSDLTVTEALSSLFL